MVSVVFINKRNSELNGMKRFFSMVACLLLGGAVSLAQYTNILDDGTTQTVSSAWSTDAVWVGSDSSSNALYVVAGGDIDSGAVYVGATSNTYYNEISMTATSRWDIAGELVIGYGESNTVSITEDSTLSATGVTLLAGNELEVDDGGSITGLTSMAVYGDSTISGDGTVAFAETNALLTYYGAGTSVDSDLIFSASSNFNNTLAYSGSELNVSTFDPDQYENFDDLVMTGSDLTGSGTVDYFDRITMTGGGIRPGSDAVGTLKIDGDFSADDTTYYAQVEDAANDLLTFLDSDTFDLSQLNLDLYVSGTTTGSVTILSAVGGLTNEFAVTEIVSRPLLYEASIQLTNDEVQVTLEPADAGTIGATLPYASTEAVRAGFGGMKNMVFTRTKQLRRNLVSTAHAIPNKVLQLTSTNAPAGAMGPGDQNTIFDMHVWVQYYNGQGEYDQNGISEAFTLNNNGTTIGADKMIGDALAVGINYTYARSSAKADGGDALDSESYWFGAYGEWVGRDGLYVDALAAYAYSLYDSERYLTSYHGTASYNGHAFGASADVGQYYYHGDHLALSPYVGLQALALTTESYTETEDAGSTVRVGEVERQWLESSIGLKLRHRFDSSAGRFQLTGYAEWTYDFIQDDVYTTLSSGGLPAARTALISPDDSGFNVGVGYSWMRTDYMEIGVGYTGRFSDSYEEHTGSLMMDVMF